MTSRPLSLPALLIILSLPGVALSQEEAARYEYQRRTEIVIRNVVNLVTPHLGAAEAAIVAQTQIRVQPTWLTNAYARRRPGGARQIIFGAGLTAYLEQIADAYITEHEGGRAGCTHDYLAYLAPGLLDNTRRAQRNLDPQGVSLFYGFAQTTTGACRGASPALFQNPETGRLFAGMMDASVAFVTLHELGHEVRGHVDAYTDDLATHRQQEAEADAWAVSTALHSGYDLRAAMPWFLLTAAIGGDTIEDEQHSDHPLGARRVLEALKQAKEVLRSSDPGSAALFDQTIQQLEREIPRN